MLSKNKKSQSGFAHPLHLLFFIIVLAVVGFAGYRVVNKPKPTNSQAPAIKQVSATDTNMGANSLDPVTKGKALANGQCSGSGTKPLTHAPMNVKDVSIIAPMGVMVGGHVTPVSHEYYYGADQSAPVDTYQVYADADGTISSTSFVNDGTKGAWQLTIAHTCTFLTNYNLITSLAPDIKSKLPAGSDATGSGGLNIPIKSGDLIGYVGHQSLDYEVWNTEKTLKGLLYPVAYNNREPSKVNTAQPLDYFTSAVKAQILPLYIRTAEPRDGRVDYDVDGEAVGTWFLEGTNGYAGGVDPGNTAYWGGHLSLVYDSLDPSALTLSIGDYQGEPTQFAIKGNTNWTKITPSSGLAKVELATRNWLTPAGDGWHGQFALNVKLTAGPTQGTALLQMTGKQTMKVEVFPGKTPDQVSGFDSAVKIYNRGQDAHMLTSNTATP